MARRNVPTTTYLSTDQRDRLRELSARSGVPAAVIIRRGVDMVLERLTPAERAEAPFVLGVGPAPRASGAKP